MNTELSLDDPISKLVPDPEKTPAQFIDLFETFYGPTMNAETRIASDLNFVGRALRTMQISPERLRLALDQLNAESGFEFERFANVFLAAEISDLRPMGGVHDGGRDAFIYSPAELPDVFCQHSVTEQWKRKITCTVKTLRHNGFRVRELIYTTNRDIQRDADDFRKFYALRVLKVALIA
jgi:hypothetical protein